MAAVEGIAPADLKVGDTISFTGPDYSAVRQRLGQGDVAEQQRQPVPHRRLLQVAIGNGRDPVVGDLAITVPLGK